MDKTVRKEELIQAAIEARNFAYVPYSRFSVGAAIQTLSGEIFNGCNIENISYSATICAERTALFSAVAKGNLQFKALAVTGGEQGNQPQDYCVPCAVCLQVLSEFCSPEMPVYVVKTETEVKEYKLKELLPVVFDSLGKES